MQAVRELEGSLPDDRTREQAATRAGGKVGFRGRAQASDKWVPLGGFR